MILLIVVSIAIVLNIAFTAWIWYEVKKSIKIDLEKLVSNKSEKVIPVSGKSKF